MELLPTPNFLRRQSTRYASFGLFRATQTALHALADSDSDSARDILILRAHSKRYRSTITSYIFASRFTHLTPQVLFPGRQDVVASPLENCL